jgi:predicted NBD/HSP70 family sugar kinase
MPRTVRPILRELVIHGAQSRTTLARRLGLSNASLTRLTKPLLAAGLVVERDIEHDPVHGRPTRPLEVVADGLRFLGVKLTAGRMHAVLTNLRAQEIVQESAPMRDMTPDTIVAQLGELAEGLADRAGPAMAVGLAVGGDAYATTPVEESEFLTSGLLGWQSVPVRRLVAERLGIPCFVTNDVTAFAHYHQWFGAARGLPDFAVITAGDGIGYALYVHGRPVRVTEADLGEFGHQILDPGGPMCPVGHRGCAFSYAATGSLQMAAAQGLRRFAAYEEVLRLAAAGDTVCAQVVRQAAWALGLVIANVVNTTMVKTVILAGEAAGVVDLARGGLESGIATRRRDPRGLTITVQPHDFAEWARGAAVVAIRGHLAGTP